MSKLPTRELPLKSTYDSHFPPFYKRCVNSPQSSVLTMSLHAHFQFLSGGYVTPPSHGGMEIKNYIAPPADFLSLIIEIFINFCVII